MALATYADLKTAVATWLSRSDLTTAIPDFIALAHNKLMRVLRTREMETIDSAFVISGELTNLPSLFLEARTMSLQVSPRQPMSYMDPQTMAERLSDTTGRPLYFSVVGSKFQFAPVPDATYTATLSYYTSLAQMSATADTNWILTSHPDAYLYGALLEATSLIQDDPRIPLWKAMYEEVVGQIKANSAKAKFGGVGMQTRPG